MQYHPTRKHRWGVILAGGEGVRLRSLTRLVSGDDRPKQFCPLLGERTLLAQTRNRIARDFSRHRTLFVLLRSHERFYAQELANVAPIQMVVQPGNRGTLPAILWSLLHIVHLDQQAVVAFFPSDHHYSDESKFMAGVELALGVAEADTKTVILLGAAAKHPEPGYGWIEAEAAISTRTTNGLLRVKQFWEKPSDEVSQELFDRGCVWNTFVMVGRAQAFLDTIRSASPAVSQALEPVLPPCREMNPAAMARVYERLDTTDFSRVVLSVAPERLGVLCIGDVGWSDLGEPQRVITALSQTGVERKWASMWHGEAAAASAAC
jgi:mannose-1-phosphate guanylyltransferase